jgi:hypothetical protein
MSVTGTVYPPADARVLASRRSVVRSAILSCVALITPLFAVLYFLTVPEGTWPRVLAAHALLALACTVVTVELCHSRIWASSSGLVLRGPLGRRQRLPREHIRELLLVHTYRGHTLDTEPQLFVVADACQTAIRLRGWLWSHETMRAIGQELDMPITTLTEPLTLGELRKQHPRLLPLLERQRAARVAVVAVTVAVVAVASVLLLGAVGLPGAVSL